MNRDILEGNWTQFKGEAREKWGKLTDDDLDVSEGQYEQLVGKIQEKYGKSREAAEREIEQWRSDK